MSKEIPGFGNRIDFARRRIGRIKGMIHPQTRALHRYFEDLRAGRPAPYRAEVDPRDMPCRAANLFILEDLGAGELRFRLAGSALTEAFGTELRGMNVRVMMEGRARESFAALIEESLAEPGVGYARLTRAGTDDDIWECLLLPLRSDFGAFDRVLGSLVPLGRPAEISGRPPLHFRIEEMTIRPIRPICAGRPEPPAAGFAESGQAPFAGPGEPEGRLKTIEGGREGPPTPRRPGEAGHLRIVRDE